MRELNEAAISVWKLDNRMESIKNQIKEYKKLNASGDEPQQLYMNNENFYFPEEFIQALIK